MDDTPRADEAGTRARRSLTRRVVLGSAGVGALTALGGGALVVAGAAESWEPSRIRGLDLWIDWSSASGAAGVADAVTGARGRHVGTAPAEARIGSRAGAGFSGTGSVVFSVDSSRAAQTTAVVLQPSAEAGSVIGAAEGSRDVFTLAVNDDGTVTAARAGVADIGRSTAAVRFDRPNLVVFQYDTNGIWCCFINGVEAGIGRTTWKWSGTGGSTRIGASAIDDSAPFTGDVGELIQWSRPLTGSELRALHDAMAVKWGTPAVMPIAADAPAPLHLPDALAGSNIAPKRSMYPGGRGSVWTEFWAEWDWDWVRTCIDRAKAAGSNAIRTIGDVQAVHSGRIDAARYAAQLQQVIDHCSANGLRYYPCGFSLQDVGSVPVAAVEQQLVAQAVQFTRHRDVVVGFDLINELASNYEARGTEEALDLAVRLLGAVRQSVPGLPLTVSDIGDLDWGVLSRSTPVGRYARLAPHVDFFDIHAYAVPADLRAWQLAAYELTIDRPLMIGEFGADATALGDERAAAYYETVRRMRAASPTVQGVFQWAVVDDAFGLTTETDGRPRTLTGRIWRTF